MTVDVYADLLFLINAVMDGVCFWLAGKVLHRPLRPWRVVLGAALGGIYAVGALLMDVGSTGALVLDAGVCIILCAIVFAGRGIGGMGGFLSTTAVYFLLSMILGGVMTALYYLFNRMGVDQLFSGGGDGPGTWLFAILALLSSGITLWGGRLFKRSGATRACRVTVELDGRRLSLEGMVDTGNLLRDPLSGRAVICGDRRLLEGLLSPALARALRDQSQVASLSPRDAKRLRLIPAVTATGNGILAGFLPDRLWISETRRGREYEREFQAVLTLTELSDTQALVPGELMN